MPDRAPPLRTERVAAASRLPAALGATLVIVLTLLAVLKPWSGATPSNEVRYEASPRETVAAISPSPQATVPEPTMNPIAMRKQCQDPNLWRLVTVELSGQLEGRSLLPVIMVAATGPSDPRIIPQLVRTGALVALGYCLPTAIDADVAATEQAVLIWQSVAGRGLVQLNDARVGDAALASVGEVYLVPTASTRAGRTGAANPTWPQGRYVFETPPNLAGGAPGWFAFTFTSDALAVAGPQP